MQASSFSTSIMSSPNCFDNVSNALHANFISHGSRVAPAKTLGWGLFLSDILHENNHVSRKTFSTFREYQWSTKWCLEDDTTMVHKNVLQVPNVMKYSVDAIYNAWYHKEYVAGHLYCLEFVACMESARKTALRKKKGFSVLDRPLLGRWVSLRYWIEKWD